MDTINNLLLSLQPPDKFLSSKKTEESKIELLYYCLTTKGDNEYVPSEKDNEGDEDKDDEDDELHPNTINLKKVELKCTEIRSACQIAEFDDARVMLIKKKEVKRYLYIGGKYEHW
ncbi:6265_t:CDS:2 [Ambispora gerdemannii]|uniref:6265_t:CDS:1 n=1 Tax=Ambispora gerdemannii TaxID=144530 RepID=A0A9N9AS63_9GLOM|nr:6265_t:CDS:2 [Ambispora gerdemannii]